jgi:hypothetical protein
MSRRARWRRPLLFALLPLALFYGTYFVSRYAVASLVTDHQSVVIAELIRSRIATHSPSLTNQLDSFAVTPSIVGRCSFLLLEEIWRDCKSIVLRASKTTTEPLQLALAVKEAAARVVANPCGEFTDTTVVYGINQRSFGCDGMPSPFRATVRLVHPGESKFEIVLKGSIQ